MAEDGILYILKFNPPFHHAKYYVGWCYPGGLYRRLQAHRTGQGAHITRAAVEAGRKLELIWDCPGTRDDERWIKNQKNTPDFVERLRRQGLLNTQKDKDSTKTTAARNRQNQHKNHEREEEMAIDTSGIDLVALIGQTVPLKRSGQEYHGPCPFCGQGKDRLFVRPAAGRWACRHCGAKGDAVNWVMQLRDMKFPEACKELGISLDSNQPKPRTPRQPLTRKTEQPNVTTPSKERESAARDNPAWRQAAIEFTKGATEWLHLKSPDALAYLYGRGFTEETLMRAWIGYNPKSRHQEWGGVKVWLPAGIVIPWFDWTMPSGIMRVNIRQAEPAGGPKYLQAAGGANWLYNGSALTAETTAILLEGEFDALTIKQALPSPTYTGVATGSASGARLIRWIAKLARCKQVLIPADNDSAGNEFAARWRMLLPENSRIVAVPQGKDVNAFYQELVTQRANNAGHQHANMMIRAWIESV